MSRLFALIVALVGAALVAVAAARPPAALPADAPTGLFSAGRAFVDIRKIAAAPHPTGSPEALRVRAYLAGRLQGMGLETAVRPVPFTPHGLARLKLWEGPNAAPAMPANVVGVLPARDRSGPAVLLMAHYDSVWGSPGAADDSAGVASALEIVRILKLGGPPARDVIVLFTDGEELNSDGARAFFSADPLIADPLASRVGAVVNLEARGSGGRALMFETGPDNGAMASLFAHAVHHPSAQSLAVFLYRITPNFTDFTISKAKGVAGFNFAFMGRAGLYHSPLATPDTVEPGAVQHLGAQALDVVRALATASALPPRAPDAAFSDVFGLGLIAYPAWGGWVLLAVSAALLVFAAVKARAVRTLTWGEAAWGALSALSLVLQAALFLAVFNRLSGAGPKANYYDRLAALPRLEAQAWLIVLAALVLLLNTRRFAKGIWAAAPAVVMIQAALLLGGAEPVTVGLGGAAAVLALLTVGRPVGIWGGWIGSAVVVFALAVALQLAAPTATPLFAWPLLLASVVAAAAAAADPRLSLRPILALLALAAALGTGFLLSDAHLAFLGVGADTPQVAAVFALLIGLLVQPLMREAIPPRIALALGAVLLIGAGGLAVSTRLAPLSPTVPIYSR